MTRYAILGHPISHSLSPLIHNTAFELLGLDCRYETVDVEPDDLKEKIAELALGEYGGFNVTIPHKETILPFLGKLEKEAKTLGAVNTVVRRDTTWTGYNTDVYGFRSCIEGYKDRMRGTEVLVLGAGGAARAVVYALLGTVQPKGTTILNRTVDRAEDLAAVFGTMTGPGCLRAEALFQEDLQSLVDRSGTIINATSVGMKPYTDASPLEEIKFGKHHLVIDLIYTPGETTLMKAARTAGATAVGGFGMLLHQAAKSFSLWTGKEMPLETVRQKVEEALKGQS
ncbi:MAG: shikimate dehydrogenase [Ignavibacteriales bacterium]|nr:shikimate dehydrogenase [Ignavibacteriales bacterium]